MVAYQKVLHYLYIYRQALFPYQRGEGGDGELGAGYMEAARPFEWANG